MPNKTIIYRNLSLFFVAIFCAGNYYGANLYEHYLGKEIESYILYSSSFFAIIFGVLYAGEKLKFNRSLTTINGRQYTSAASGFISNNSIDPSLIETVIKNGKSITRTNTIKYRWVDNNIGNIIVILDKKNVVLEVSC